MVWAFRGSAPVSACNLALPEGLTLGICNVHLV